MTEATGSGGGMVAAGGRLRRWAPVLAILALMTAAFAMGWQRHLSLQTIGLNYEALQTFIAGHLVVALLLYVLAYVAVVALSLPGGLVMTLTGGLLFGWKLGAPAAVIGATTGATIIFLAAKTSFGDVLGAKTAPWIGKLRAGFNENALSYLLFLRLVPAFPFFAVNLAPALLGVPLRTFVLGTFLGIIPATIAFSATGAGLGSAIEAQNAIYKACLARRAADASVECDYALNTGALVTNEVLLAFVLLGLVALVPVAFKAWSKRHVGR
jgi:uncharacterized membrane protein YdjX (TVP38/TMEM64 family)